MINQTQIEQNQIIMSFWKPLLNVNKSFSKAVINPLSKNLLHYGGQYPIYRSTCQGLNQGYNSFRSTISPGWKPSKNQNVLQDGSNLLAWMLVSGVVGGGYLKFRSWRKGKSTYDPVSYIK